MAHNITSISGHKLLKIKELIGETYNAAGLSFINLLARFGPYTCSEGEAFGDLPRQRLDVYRTTLKNDADWIVFFYGGNWRSGERSSYRFVADTLTRLGFNVVIPDYRLYPEVRFPEIRDDVVSALDYVFRRLSGARRVFVMGHSAGAQLGSIACLEQALQARWPEGAANQIGGFVGLAGPYDFYPFTEDDHWDLFAPADDYERTQAVNHVHEDAPPMYLLHGEDDTRVRRGHSKSLMEKLQAAGGAASREVYPGMSHVGILLSFTRLHRGRSKVVRDIADFLESRGSSGINANSYAGNAELKPGLKELP